MKVVVVAQIIGQSSGRYVERLLYHLQKIDSQNRYTVILKPDDYTGWVPSASNFSKQKFDFKRYSLFSQIKLTRLLNKHQPNVVHFTFQPDVFTPLVVILYRGKKVLTVHDLTQLRIKNRKRGRFSFQILHWGFKVILKHSVRSADHIIVPSKFVKYELQKRLKVPAGKISVTYEAADKLSVSQPKIVEGLVGQRFVLYVGTAHAHKNLDRLLKAFARTKKALPGTKLVLVGKKDVFYERLERRTMQMELEDVIFTGFVSDQQLAWLYQNASVYVFPSLSEGFGLPGLEAMNWELPVASSNTTCLPEIYGEGAAYFNPRDVEEMSQVIVEILTNTRLRKKLAQAGLKQSAKYSWSRMSSQSLEIYKQVSS